MAYQPPSRLSIAHNESIQYFPSQNTNNSSVLPRDRRRRDKKDVFDQLMEMNFEIKYIYNALRYYEQRSVSANYDIDVLIGLIYELKVKEQLKTKGVHFTYADEVEDILLDCIGFDRLDVESAMLKYEQKYLSTTYQTAPFNFEYIATDVMNRRAKRLRTQNLRQGAVTGSSKDNDAYDVCECETEAKYNDSAAEPTPMPVADLSSQYGNRCDEEEKEPTLTDIDQEYTAQEHIAAPPKQQREKASSISWHLAEELRYDGEIVVPVHENPVHDQDIDEIAEDELESVLSPVYQRPKDDDSVSPNTMALLAEDEKEDSNVAESIPAPLIHCNQNELEPPAGWEETETCACCRTAFGFAYFGMRNPRKPCPLWCKRVLCETCIGHHFVGRVVDGERKDLRVCGECMLKDYNQLLRNPSRQ